MKTHVLFSLLFWMVAMISLTAQTPWLPNPANSTVDIHRTGNIGIGAQPQARVHIETPCDFNIGGDCEQFEGADIRMKRSFQLLSGSPVTAWRIWDIYNAGTTMGFSFTENASGSGGVPKMTLNSSGFLDVTGNVAVRGGRIRAGAQGQEHFVVNTDGRLSVGQTGSEHLIVAPNGQLTVGASGSEHLVLKPNGELTVGASGNEYLTVKPENDHGRVAIGTTDTPIVLGTDDISAYRLYVEGGILSREVRVRSTWSDYVFEPDYVLLSLPEVEAHIAEHGHLHDTPSGAEVEANGLNVGSMMANQRLKPEMSDH